MKVLAILFSIILLLIGLPWLHGFFVCLSIETLALHPTAMSFFYLFTIPAWVMVIMIFVFETYRRGFIRSRSRISNTMMLGLSGMIVPGAGLALSPVGTEIGVTAYTGVAVIGLLVGLLGAVLFNFTIARIEKKGSV